MAKTKDEKDQSATLSADQLDAIGAKFTRPEAWHEPQRAAEPVVVLDDSPANDIGHVPDPPYHGRWNLLVGVNFPDGKGGETRIDASEIDGSELPLDLAHDLFVRNLLIKA